MVRPAELKDIPEMVAISREFYDEMDFDSLGYRFDPLTVEESYHNGVTMPDKFVLLISEREGINGIFFAAINTRSLYFNGHRYAQEIVWHGKPSLSPLAKGRVMVSLLKYGETILHGMPFYLSSDHRKEFDGVGEYLEKHGYREMSRYWYKEA